MPANVLIVDDEVNILMALEFAFSKAGMNVFVARGGAEAQALLEEHNFNLAVLDIMMEDVDGYALCEQIKAERGATTRVIFLSAKSRPEDIEYGLSLGAERYFTKPFSPKQIIAASLELIQAKDQE
jgi:DNA-binding response OmpR family regulator